jgi:RNA polymerase primary sigma factor
VSPSTQIAQEVSSEPAGEPQDSLRLFLLDVGRRRRLTPADEIRLAKRVERGDQSAKHSMIEANLRLVISIARATHAPGVPLLDLIQEGALGLNRAVEKYDWRRGCRFSTYATWWIREAVQRAAARETRRIQVPSHVVDRQRRLRRAAGRLEAELRRAPTPDELAEATGLSPRHVEGALDAPDASVSLNQPVGAEGVELRFGLRGPKLTLDAVGRRVGLRRERVRQLETQALQRLSRWPHW